MHPILRATLESWITERSTWSGASATAALFLNRHGGRLSPRGAYDVLTGIAEAAGIDVGRDREFTPHVLRHTAATTMTRAGTDIVVVAEILGHSMETARRYALPSPEDRHTAMNRLTTDQ